MTSYLAHKDNYIARYKDELGMSHWRKFYAPHDRVANKKASSIGQSHKWKIVSVGKI